MEAGSVETIVRAFNANGVRYLIAGGLAVVAHGYVRFTADMDLIIDLEPANLRQAMSALTQLEYQPRAPVGLSEFADPEHRARWVREKGLTVFSLYSPRHPATEIDVFVELPLDFERAYQSAERMEVAPGVSATFIGLDDLSDKSQKHDWDRGWDGHDTRQLRRLAALPLTEKLRWLEEAHRLVRHLSGATKQPAAGKVSR